MPKLTTQKAHPFGSGWFHRMLIVAVLCFAIAAGAAGFYGQSPRGSAGTQTVSKPSYSPLDVAKGRAVFQQRCAICHFSESTAQKIGPGLAGLYARGKFADGKRVDDTAVERWIESGGKDMPGFKDAIKLDQMRVLIAYMRGL